LSEQAFITSVEAAELDDSCGRKTWLGRKEGGRGIIRKDQIVPLSLLAETHEDMRYLQKMMDISPKALQWMVDNAIAELTEEDRTDRKKMELLYRRLGWFVAYALYMEPKVREKYWYVDIDSEVVLDHDPLWIVTQPDRIIKSKTIEETIYQEFVPMPAGLTNTKWLEQWRYNIRLHVGMAAIEDLPSVKQHVNFGQVIGMHEGYVSMADYRLVHPYVWGYHNEVTDAWSVTYKIGGNDEWKIAPVWNYPGGVVAWVQMCGETIAANQFPKSPLIELDNALVDSWVARRLHREREIGAKTEICFTNVHLRSIHFEKRTAQCRPAQGEACPYLNACWDAKLRTNPYKSGEYISSILPVVEVKTAEVVA